MSSLFSNWTRNAILKCETFLLFVPCTSLIWNALSLDDKTVWLCFTSTLWTYLYWLTFEWSWLCFQSLETFKFRNIVYLRLLTFILFKTLIWIPEITEHYFKKNLNKKYIFFLILWIFLRRILFCSNVFQPNHTQNSEVESFSFSNSSLLIALRNISFV